MRLSRAEVEHVALLAQLALSDREVELFRKQLSSILEYVECLRQVDTRAIPPMTTILPQGNVLREDEVEPSLSLPDVLANAPAVEDGLFQVPAVLEGDG